MEQSDADRAAVAREVLTELEQHFRDDPLQGLGATAATVVKWFRDEHYPAPPAPETVTVTVGGRVWAREVDGWWVHHSDTSHDVCGPKSTIGEMCARIASDARVIRELERSRDGWDADARREAGNVLYWRGERDRAIEAIKERDARIAELERQLSASQKAYYDVADAVAASSKGPDDLARIARETRYERDSLRTERDAARARIAELETQLQRALDGAVFREKRAHHAEQERDDALRALDLVKGEAGDTVAASEPLASESPAATSPSPAPIPLGAVVEVEGVEWTRTESGWDGGARWYHDGSTAARALTALYRARHPVATRETVERVRKALLQAFRATRVGEDFTENCTRAALTAAGFTLEEGA